MATGEISSSGPVGVVGVGGTGTLLAIAAFSPNSVGGAIDLVETGGVLRLLAVGSTSGVAERSSSAMSMPPPLLEAAPSVLRRLPLRRLTNSLLVVGCGRKVYGDSDSLRLRRNNGPAELASRRSFSSVSLVEGDGADRSLSSSSSSSSSSSDSSV